MQDPSESSAQVCHIARWRRSAKNVRTCAAFRHSMQYSGAGPRQKIRPAPGKNETCATRGENLRREGRASTERQAKQVQRKR